MQIFMNKKLIEFSISFYYENNVSKGQSSKVDNCWNENFVFKVYKVLLG